MKRAKKPQKRYLVSYGEAVNRQASKTGIKYVFSGRTDDPEEKIAKFKEHPDWYGGIGIRIKDSQTGKIIYEG